MNSISLSKNFSFIEESLRNAKKKDRLAHAYLVHHDNKSIRDEFVLFLSKLIACSQEESKQPCGKCLRCISLEKGYYPDLYKLEANSKSRRILIGDEKEPNTMRFFQSMFYYSSSSVGNKKIGIIYDADRVVEEAQNAFLKTLEEPPLDTFFIILTSNKKSLLPTIISRCHYISLLTNNVSYDFRYAKSLFSILYQITISKKTMSAVEEFRLGISSVLGNLLEDSKNEVLVESGDSSSKEMTAKERKRLVEASEALINARYIVKKNEIINAILVWFSELYQLSVGIKIENLALGKIILDLDKNNLLKDIKTQSYANMLKTSERFYNSMKYNIDESLAVTDLVINLIFQK